MKVLTIKPTITAGAYSAGDAVGGLLTFDYGKSGLSTVVLKKVEILDDDASPDSAELNLHLFTDATMAVADNAAFTVTQANFLAGKYLGYINLATYAATVVGTNAGALIAIEDDLTKLLPLANGKLYGQLVAVGTPTMNATGQLLVSLHLGEYA